jgi:acyl carrier protein
VLEHPLVTQAAAVVEQGDDTHRLLAYVVTSGDIEADELVRQLRDELTGRLPRFMIPSGFVVLDRLPLTPNGKIDRCALHASDEPVVTAHRDYIAPRNDTETAIARLWSELLGVRDVGANDNFFDLGGDSLATSRMVQVLCDRYQVSIPVREILLDATIARVATLVDGSCEEQRAGTPTTPPAPQLDALSDAEFDALIDDWRSPRQGRATHDRIRERRDHQAGGAGAPTRRPARQRDKRVPGAAPSADAHAARAGHACRAGTRIPPAWRGRRRVAAAGTGGTVRRARHPAQHLRRGGRATGSRRGAGRPRHRDRTDRRRGASADFVRRHTEREQNVHFDLSTAPLVRATLLHLDPETHVLLLTTHDLVADEWTADILVRDLMVTYRAILSNAPDTAGPAALGARVRAGSPDPRRRPADDHRHRRTRERRAHLDRRVLGDAAGESAEPGFRNLSTPTARSRALVPAGRHPGLC